MLRRKRNLGKGYCAYGCCGPNLPARVERRVIRRREKQAWSKW